MEQDIDAYADHARHVIDSVVDIAMRKLNEAIYDRQRKLESELSRQQSAISLEESIEVGNIEWPTIREFDIEVGQSKINEYISTWNRHDSWLYCIDFLREDDHEFDTRYQYRVRWSIPTRRKPIPRATCSVYFTLSISKIKPLNTVVDVYYVVETNQLIHRPGKSQFREKWLKDVADSKISLMDVIYF